LKWIEIVDRKDGHTLRVINLSYVTSIDFEFVHRKKPKLSKEIIVTISDSNNETQNYYFGPNSNHIWSNDKLVQHKLDKCLEFLNK
tara:strand:+ start:536 stop:793 length:258 start_codon:yes stop_codon:yes gene_type:complete